MEEVQEEIRQGYKLTQIGLIPADWKLVKLDDIATVQTGVQKGAKNTGKQVTLPYLRVANVQDGHIDLDEVKHIEIPEDKVERYLLQTGDVLMNEGGDFDKLGRGVVWDGQIQPCVHQNHVFAVRVDDEFLTPGFLNLLTKTYYGRKYFILNSKQSTNLASINSTQLKNFPVLLPSLQELLKIENLIAKWDKAIENLTQLITEKQQKKKALMQQLLTGKKRFPAFTKASAGKPVFDGEWKEVKLGEYFTERKESKRPDLPLLSIGSSGVYPQTDSNKKDTSNADKAKYKRICPDDIGYNTMRMWQGRSALSSLEGIVSPAYTIVTPKENADVLFFSYLFKFPYVVHRFFRNSQGLVDDTLNCKFKDFAIVKVMVPPTKEEQTKIAQVLRNADAEIKVLEQKKEHLQDQKKGLMQQLLTGKKRLKY